MEIEMSSISDINLNKYKNILCVKPYSSPTESLNYKTLSGKFVPKRDTYMADLIICFKENEIEILKNRYGINKKFSIENDDEFAKFLLLL